MSKLQQSGLVKFNDRQSREAAEYIPLNEKPPGMGDFLWDSAFATIPGYQSAVGALNVLGATGKYITGQRTKVSPYEQLKRKLGKQ